MRGSVLSSIVLGAAALATVSPLQAAVLIDSNFNSVPGPYPVTVNNGDTVDGLLANVVANSAITVVDLGGGDNAVTFTDNVNGNTTGQSPYLRKTVNSGISTDGTGNNHVTGSFTFRRTPPSVGSEGSFRFLMRPAGIANPNETNTLVLLRVNGTGISASNGSTVQASVPGFSVAANTTYTFEVDVDLSSGIQDTWFFRIKDSGGALLFTSPVLNTSMANATPVEFLFTGGVNGTQVSTESFVRLDNIHFEANPVPEPGVLMFGGMAGLLALRRSRRAGRNCSQL